MTCKLTGCNLQERFVLMNVETGERKESCGLHREVLTQQVMQNGETLAVTLVEG